MFLTQIYNEVNVFSSTVLSCFTLRCFHHFLSVVDRGRSMVDGLSMVGRGRGVVGRRMSLVGGLVLVVVGLTLVSDIGDVARVAIVDLVGDDLGPAVGKGNAVLAVGGIAIPVLILAEVGTRVAVLDTVLVVVGSGLVMSGLMVGRGRGVVGGSVVDRGSLVDSMVHGGSMVTEGNGPKGSESNEDLRKNFRMVNAHLLTSGIYILIGLGIFLIHWLAHLHDDVWFELLTWTNW